MSKEEEKVIPVRVAVRCRPMVQWESEEGCVPCVTFVPGEPQIVLSGEKAFTFDFVFDPATEQEEVFSSAVSPLIDGIFKGYNATVLAYGQTGSGKTFTMGGAYSGDAEPHATGVIPRAVHALFRGVQSRGTVEFSVSVSYLEIYKEDIIDLLCVSKDRPPLSVREDPKEGIKICGLTERVVASAEDMVRCLEQGNLARTVGATAMNAQSSRSHAIFTIAIEQRGKEDRESHCRSKLHLVDLAGSERVKRTKAEGDRLREGITINRGLLALGNVISALGEEGAARRTHHVPYRDSRLTRLLQDSLGGNSLTLMVACVSPADSNLEETLNTLRYADRARKIKNKPVVNRDPSTAELQMLRKQVQQLQVQLLQAQGGGIATMQGGEGQSASVQSVLERNRSLHEANQQLTKELQVAVDHTAHLCEKVILARRVLGGFSRERVQTEMEREKLLTRFAELKDHKACRLDIMSLVDSQGEEGSLRQQLELLQSLQELINELETDTSSLDPLDAEGKEGGSPGDEACVAGEGGERLSDSSFSARHTLRQAQLTRELLELNRALEMKEQLARGASRNDCKMDELSTTYTEGIKGLEKEVSSLQREKEELTSALQAAMKDTTHAKLSEQRRKRLQELEAQMSDLKKKIAEQTRLLRLKENTVRSVSKLHSEIQAMKTQRVQLMRQMKEDAEKFRQWKAQKDKEVLQLKEKDRKRQYELVKLERDFQKQAAVLRRKTEEAGAANRRLRDALTRQKEVAEKRKETQSRGAETLATRVKTWLAHELEVLVSTEDARRHLADLLEDRAVLASDLARLRHQRDESRGPSCSQPPSKIRRRTLLLSELEEALGPSEELSQQIVSLETEIGLRAQIADLQQKLLGVGSEERGRQRWDAITTILEAKCALRWLLDQLVAARVGSARASEELREAREARDEALRSATEERDRAQEERERLVEEMGRLETEHQDKVLLLLNQLQSSSGHQSGDQQRESNLCLQKEQLEQMAQLREENQTLQQKLQQLQRTKKRLPAALGAVGEQTGPRAASPDSSLEFVPLKKSTAKQRRPSAPARPLVSLSHILSETETSDSDGETRGSGGPVDADWEPGGAAASRPSLQRRSKNSTAPGCRCGGRCVNRLCGCQRAGLECVAWRCGCDHDKCRNRSDAGGKVAAEKLETSSSSDGSFKRDEPSGVVRPPGESFFMPPDVAPSPQVLKEMGDTGLLSALSDPSLRTSLLTNASPAQELRAGGGGGSGGGGSGGGGAAKKRQLLRLGHSGLLAACSPVPPM